MMRFNHMELTLPVGTLTDDRRREIDDFYGTVFGWSGIDAPVVGQLCHLLMLDEHANQFLLLSEHESPMSAEGFHHLGLLQDTRDDVDGLLARCRRYQCEDDRVQIKEYDDIVGPSITTHAFYVKYLLPIWFDVQSMDRSAPAPGWRYG